MIFRRLFVLAIALLATALRAAAADGSLTIDHVYTGWREAASFKRISEYFDGRENTGGEAVLRTQPHERSGYYFLVRVKNAGAARPVTATLHVISAFNSRPNDYRFPVELKAGDTVFHLGLTGSDWANAKAHPVAWKLDLADADGRLLVTDTSYLWEKPAAK